MLHTPAPAQAGLATNITDQIAQAMIEANAHGGATRQALIEMGFKPGDLDTHGEAAKLRAIELFQRKSERPAYDRAARVVQASRLIGHLLPGTPALTMHLQSRGFGKSELDDIFTEALAAAADAFAGEGGAA